MSAMKKPRQTSLTLELAPGVKQSMEKIAANKNLSLMEYARQVLEQACAEEAYFVHKRGSEDIGDYLMRKALEHSGGRVFDDDSVDFINEARNERSQLL